MHRRAQLSLACSISALTTPVITFNITKSKYDLTEATPSAFCRRQHKQYLNQLGGKASIEAMLSISIQTH